MESLRNMLDTLIGIIPEVVVFIVILVIGWIVAKLLEKVVDKILSRVGFDRAVERSGIHRWMGSYDPSRFFSRLVYYAILLIALQMAFNVFGPNPVSNVIDLIVAFLPHLFVALLIVVIAAAIGGAVRDVVSSGLSGLSYGRMLGVAAQVFIVALGVIAALSQIGVATAVTTPVLVTILATVGGVIVVGVGGGLIQPMRDRWERMLQSAEGEYGNVRSQMAAKPPATAAGEPQPSYQAQRAGAAVDPSHPRAAEAATEAKSTPSDTTQAGQTREQRQDMGRD